MNPDPDTNPAPEPPTPQGVEIRDALKSAWVRLLEKPEHELCDKLERAANSVTDLERDLAEAKRRVAELDLSLIETLAERDSLRAENERLKADKERLTRAVTGAYRDLRPIYDYFTIVTQDRASEVSKIRERLSDAIDTARTQEGQG